MTRKSGSSGKKNGGGGGEVKKRNNKKCSSSSSSSSSTASSSIMETKMNQEVRKKKTGCVNNRKQQSTSNKMKKAKPVKSNSNTKTKARESKGKCKTIAVVNPKKRKLIDEEIEIIDTRSCKRMASLNASAILASLSERRVNLNHQSRPPAPAIESSTRSTRSTVVKILETEISSSESRLQVSTSVPDLESVQYPERRLSAKQSRLIESSTRSTGSTRSTRSTVFKILETEISSSESRVQVSSPEPDLEPQYPERRLSSTKQSRSIESARSTAATRSTGSTVVKILETKISSSDSQHCSSGSNIGPSYPEKRVSKQNRSIDSSKRSGGPSTKSTGSTVVKIFETKISSSDSQHVSPVSNMGSQYPERRVSKQCRSIESKRSQQSGSSSKSTGSTVVKIRETKISSSDSQHVAQPSVHNIRTLQYPNERRILSKPCRATIEATTSTGTTTMAKIFETDINPASSILQVPPISSIGRPQYPPHYASAFSVPHHINHAASINYPAESYGLYQHSVGCGPIMQPIHDPYIRAYSLHKPIPYYASQMAHHPDQTYREFNPIVDFSPIITNNNNHSRSPSSFNSPLTVNNQQSNVATISPLVTSRNNRCTTKSVSCSTNTDPEPTTRRSHQHHSQHLQQNNNPQSSFLNQSSITITPLNVNSSGNHTNANNLFNSSASVTNSSSSSQTNNSNSSRDANYNVNINGGNNNSRHQTIASSFNNLSKDASVNTIKNGKDSPTTTINMARKNQRKQFENSTNHHNSIGKQSRTLTNRSNRYPQSLITSSSSLASSSPSSPAPIPAISSVATNTSSSISTSPSSGINNISPGTNSSSSLSSSSSGHHQLVTGSTNTNHVINNNNTNKKVITISNNHVNGQLSSSSKKRPTKSNKTLIDSNSAHGESSTSLTTTTTITSTSDQISGSRKTGKKRLFHGWSWRGNPSKKPVFIKPDEPPQLRDCYPAICHIQGDVIKVRDSVLLRGGPRKTDLHFVAKICALWEAPETGEMMMSLLWYYRPEHTEPGRKPHDQLDEIFASKHQDVNSVACIDDKCYVLTFNEYCRYRKRQKMDAENIATSLTHTSVPTGKDYNRRSRLPMRKVFPDRVFFCRKVYDFRLGRTLKNPVPPVISDISAWRR